MAESTLQLRYQYVEVDIEVTSTAANQVAYFPYPNGMTPKGLIVTKGNKVGATTTTLTDVYIQSVQSAQDGSYIRYTAPSTGNYTLHLLYIF